MLSIIILTYNSQDTIVECLKSIEQSYQNKFQQKEFELIVSDNNSTDATLDVVKKYLDKSKNFLKKAVIQNRQNVGFAKGINQAAQKAEGDVLLFLNPDTIVLNKGIVEMNKYMGGNENVAIMGGRIKKSETEDELSAGRDYSPLHVFLLALSLDEKLGMRFAPQKIQIVDWVSGGFMLVKKDVFEKLGGFDEKYFMYLEDADLGKRAREAGYEVVFHPAGEVLHKNHGSSNKGFAIASIYKSLIRYTQKHYQSALFLVKFLLVAKAKLIVAVSLFTNNKANKHTYKKAQQI